MSARRYDPLRRKSSWSAILRFFYVWSILAILLWSPVYSGAYGGVVVPAYGKSDPVIGMDTPSVLKVGDRYEFTTEARWHWTHLIFQVAEEKETGFVINATYRLEAKPPKEGAIEVVRPYPTGVHEERFLVDGQGHPLEETYASSYWASLWQT